MNKSPSRSNLLWRLLRQHISLPQFLAFFLANLLGMFIVLLGFQFYRDVRAVFLQEDNFLGQQYLIINKHVSAANVIGLGRKTMFTEREIEALRHQSFCRSVGAFTPSCYDVYCSMGIEGIATFGTEMFFESVPDSFIDADLSQWHFDAEEGSIPIILPRSYLALYNFGFAQTRSLPKLSEGVVGMIQIKTRIRGNGLEESFNAHVVGFSSRLNTILVPQSFMEWSNRRFSPSAVNPPSRLILRVTNAADESLVSYMKEHKYEVQDNKADLGRTVFVIRLLATLVIAVGALISLLSFYLLMLSIYLLVQKNTEKIQTLMLIGYSPRRVAMPYQALTFIMNTFVLLLAFALLLLVRHYYLSLLHSMFPGYPEVSLWPTLLLGGLLLFVVTCCNTVAIHQRISSRWNNKE